MFPRTTHGPIQGEKGDEETEDGKEEEAEAGVKEEEVEAGGVEEAKAEMADEGSDEAGGHAPSSAHDERVPRISRKKYVRKLRSGDEDARAKQTLRSGKERTANPSVLPTTGLPKRI